VEVAALGGKVEVVARWVGEVEVEVEVEKS